MTRIGQRLAQAVKNFLRPARTATTLTGTAVVDAVRPRAQLVAENAFLRQQLLVLRRTAATRPRLHREDRLILVLLARIHGSWRDALHLVQPDTLLRWHRYLFTILWRRKSRPKHARTRVSPDVVELIRTMARANGLWGAERIRGELLKLGISLSKRTVQKYLRAARPRGDRGQTWGTFLRNHAAEIWACDFLQVYDAWFRPLFAFVIIRHNTREIVHLNVTRSPTDAWVAQQLREATPYEQAPRFLIRDNDNKFGSRFAAAADGAGIDIVTIPPKSPNLNALCERFLGSLRHECLDHILILGEGHLRRVLAEWMASFNTARPHQGIDQAVPIQPRGLRPPPPGGAITVRPVLGGLHHDYRRAA